MTRFMYQSACRGQRPPRVQALRYRSRASRVALLARERRRPRFLVAPAGFGKAMLAAEYAETMFGFRHVFWVNGASPCFLRDVDGGTMTADLAEVDEQAALVVFADVPLLDEERAEAFAALIDRVAAAGIEVIVTTTPGCDSFSALVRNAVVVRGSQLLLDEGEAPDVPGAGDAAARVACLAWAAEGQSALAEGCAHEEMPADLRAALWAMLVMGRGCRGDVRALLGADRGDEAWDYLEGAYPFLGIDGEEGVFRTVSLDLGVVVRSFAGAMESMARAVGCGRRGDLACLLADRILRVGEGARAAQLVGAVAPRAAVGAWLGRCGWELVRQGAAAEVCRLYDVACRTKLVDRAAVNAMVACAHAQLGHRTQALGSARKVLSATLAPDSLKATAALCTLRQGTAEARRRATETLVPWLEGRVTAAGADEEPASSDALLALLVELALLESGRQALRLCCQRIVDMSQATRADEMEGYLLAIAWAVDAAAACGAVESNVAADDEVSFAVRWALGTVRDRMAEERPLGYGGEEAVLALDRVGAALEEAGLPRPAPALVDAACAARAARDRAARDADAAASPALPVATGGRPMRRSAAAPALLQPTAPLLEVRLFGGVRAFIGGREVSPKLLASRRSRALLSLLVLHRGCELAREDLVAMLWPRADVRTGRKSFYRLWQNLQSVLSVDGACPYLVRDRYGCRLDTALFASDVMEFEDLVRQLLFGTTIITTGWERAYDQVRTMFSGELAPSEVGNEVIDGFRERFSMELTDGLVAASGRLRAAGELQGALWFARAALERDAGREDAYAALMEAQLVAGQRSGAVATYHACRRYLADSLGLDPSRHLGALYQRVIDESPSLLV